MTRDQQTIAWLIPTSHGTYADKATTSASNKFRLTSITSSPFLSSRLSALTPSSTPRRAIRLAFDQPPKRPGSFILGTDPSSCDIVLPSLPGIAHQHCALAFDAEDRLTIEDFSQAGTQVWYDWESNGDRANYTWVLSSGGSPGFPDAVRRVEVDIQGVRFQVVANDFSRYEGGWDAYHEKVEGFCTQPNWTYGLTSGWDRASVSPVAPLFSAAPLFQHIFVKSLGENQPVSEVYLWNMAKPWEPMVKASA